MQYSVVPFSKIDLGNRIDSEYFEPEFLQLEKVLLDKKSQPLNSYCKITASAFYPAATHLYSIGNVPFIRCVDIINFPVISDLQNESFEKIPDQFLKDYKNVKKIKKGEITISKVGTPCFASIIHDLDEVALSRTVLGLRNIKNINPYFFTAFLRSKYGYRQLIRERELTIQYQLTLDRVANILVFKPESLLLENRIGEILKKSFEINQSSKSLYSEAENLLLEELGLKDWKPKHQLSYIKNYSDMQKAQRFDAEYFQPQYDEIIEKVKNIQNDDLGNIVKWSKGIEVGSEQYIDEGFDFIRISDFNTKGLSETSKKISKELFSELKDKFSPKKGDILFTKDGTIGLTYLVNQDQEAIISGAFLKLRPKIDIESEYLALVLNSIMCKKQIEMMSGGAIIAHLKPSDAMKLQIPILSPKKQQEISSKIIDSKEKDNQSKSLLSIAKKAVEMAIETSEEQASSWIDQELEKLGVELKKE
jgi:type I restriction enzyme S subunit